MDRAHVKMERMRRMRGLLHLQRPDRTRLEIGHFPLRTLRLNFYRKVRKGDAMFARSKLRLQYILQTGTNWSFFEMPKQRPTGGRGQ